MQLEELKQALLQVLERDWVTSGDDLEYIRSEDLVIEAARNWLMIAKMPDLIQDHDRVKLEFIRPSNPDNDCFWHVSKDSSRNEVIRECFTCPEDALKAAGLGNAG